MKEQDQFENLIRTLSDLDDVPTLNPLRKESARRVYLEYAARLRARRTPVTVGARASLTITLLRFAAASLSAFILAMGILTGAAYAADGAGPGDLLYPIDRGVEELQLRLAPDPEHSLRLLLRFADERVTESEQLAAEGDEENMAVALDAYGQTISSIAETMGGAGDQQVVLDALINAALTNHEQRLSSIRAHVPEQALSGLDRAIGAAHNELQRTLPENQPEEPGASQTPPGEGKPDSTSDPQDEEPGIPPYEPASHDHPRKHDRPSPSHHTGHGGH